MGPAGTLTRLRAFPAHLVEGRLMKLFECQNCGPSVLRIAPEARRDPALAMAIDFDPYRQNDFDALVQTWLPLTYATNGLNRSMVQPDLYLFVLAPEVMAELRFVHGQIYRRGA
jgi:hypothetical protein